jgi:hypothetical protein
MPPHRQHQFIQSRILEGRQRVLDVVDRPSQRTFESGVLIKPELVLQVDHVGEILRIGVESAAQRVDVARQLSLAHGGERPRHDVECRSYRLARCVVGPDVLIVFAQQKVLLIAARLKERNFKVFHRPLKRGSRGRDFLIMGLPSRADE